LADYRFNYYGKWTFGCH